MRIVYFGTPIFALPTLETLWNTDSIELSGVLTQPDRPAGRKKKLHPPPVKEWATEHNVDWIQPEKLKDPDVMPWLERHKPDAIVVVAYGGFVPKTVREFPPHGCVNLHPSLLPRYRGAAPMQWAIINGDRVTGNTTMYLSAGWDDGDTIYQEEEPIETDDTYDSLAERLAESGSKLMVRTLQDIENGTAPRHPQPDEGVVMAPMIENENAHIDWNRPAQDIHNNIRGLTSIPGAFTECNGNRIKIFRTEVLEMHPAERAAGEVVSTKFNTIRVASQDNIVEILELQPSGKRRMKAAEYLRGHDIQPGTRLT